MKNISVALFILFLSSSAFAHITPGTYLGTDASGQSCSMEAIETFYLNGTRHPLNERVRVRLGGEEFLLMHPPVIDAATSTAHFNHDSFHAVNPTDQGARALIVEMSHQAGQEGPVSFTWIEHAWRANTRTGIACKGLKLQ